MARETTKQRAQRTPLSRERILDTAIQLVDEEGIESLTMRKLGEALGVEAMSLYYYVANKGEVVDAIVDQVLGEIDLPAAHEDWRTAIRTCAISAHQAFLRHPWACQLAMFPTSTRGGRVPRLRYMEWLLGRLHDAGFPPELTYSACHALDSHMMGFTLWQLGHRSGAKDVVGDDVEAFATGFMRELRDADYLHLAEHVEQHISAPDDDGEREFQFALDLILDGLENARKKPRP
jgi:AcrR family transcriptional regulator